MHKYKDTQEVNKMANSLFVKIKEAVTQWIKDDDEKFKSKNIILEIVENNKERLYVILNFGECMAAIVVAEPDFAPYRFVSFEAAAMKNDIMTMPYSWYDEEGNTIEEIIKNLDKAIDIVLEYSNSQMLTSHRTYFA
jgi:hypothetical protein